MPTALLQTLARETKAYPYTALSDAEAEELANRYRETAEDLRRVAAVLLFLKQRLIDTGQEPLVAVAEGRELLGRQDIAEGREEEIASVLSYSRDEREEALAVRAFSGGPAFLSTRIRPSLLPVESAGVELVGSYLWTISYLNAEGEQRTVTIGLTPGELAQLEQDIDRAKEQLRAIKEFSNSTQAARG